MDATYCNCQEHNASWEDGAWLERHPNLRRVSNYKFGMVAQSECLKTSGVVAQDYPYNHQLSLQPRNITWLLICSMVSRPDGM